MLGGKVFYVFSPAVQLPAFEGIGMSVTRAVIEADIRRYVGDDGAANSSDYRFNTSDITQALQKALNRIFDEVPAYLYDTAIVTEVPTIDDNTATIAVTAAGRNALGHLSAYYLMIEDAEDSNNVAVANVHYSNYMRERLT